MLTMVNEGPAVQLADRPDEPVSQPTPPGLAVDSAINAVSSGRASPDMHSLDAAITVAKIDAKTPTTATVVETVQSEFEALALSDDRSQEQLPGPPEDGIPPTSSSPSLAGHALQVRLNKDPNLGFCVYALRRFDRGDVLYTERTAIEALHHPDHRGVRNVYQYYTNMSHERRAALHGAFPMLAWANGVDAYEAAEGRTLIGSRVITKGFNLDICLSAEDHIRMRPDMPVQLRRQSPGRQPAEQTVSTAATTVSTIRLKGKKTRSAFSELFHPTAHLVERDNRSKSTSRIGGKSWRRKGRGWGADDENEDAKSHRSFKSVSSWKSRMSQRSIPGGAGRDKDWAQRETLKWFGRYAFRLKPGTAFLESATDQAAAVYLLTDLINHRCAPYQNCRVQPKIGFVSVIAERDIEVGEELTINYNKSKKDFDCKGECCQ
ncbi:set domain containing protein [Grosmannia clavigera kw1407]|uniref:Set domain containing protein n=1 Tax=Grosmannia clavigera (strain kw1407 / UAMH 11150) TaxID=655863 RepID=F0XRN7_GROCL|nr:set domain containing protein [Grosmannia clavigera kw1407]EFW99513.1 set domain containing protein [Grosmannia clavigera kw1407]